MRTNSNSPGLEEKFIDHMDNVSMRIPCAHFFVIACAVTTVEDLQLYLDSSKLVLLTF